MNKSLLFIGPLVGGIVGWVLSGNYRLGITLFVALAAGNLVTSYYRK